jgi:hypothetical protein
VFFSGIHNNGNVYGNTTATTQGFYISHKQSKAKIEQSLNLRDVIVTNVIELNEHDYKSWIGEFDPSANEETK